MTGVIDLILRLYCYYFGANSKIGNDFLCLSINTNRTIMMHCNLYWLCMIKYLAIYTDFDLWVAQCQNISVKSTNAIFCICVRESVYERSLSLKWKSMANNSKSTSDLNIVHGKHFGVINWNACKQICLLTTPLSPLPHCLSSVCGANGRRRSSLAGCIAGWRQHFLLSHWKLWALAVKICIKSNENTERKKRREKKHKRRVKMHLTEYKRRKQVEMHSMNWRIYLYVLLIP